MLNLIILMISVTVLAIAGCGIFYGATSLITALLCATAAITCKGNLSRLAVASAALVTLVLVTLVPLPLSLSKITGQARYEQNLKAKAAIERAVSAEAAEEFTPLFTISRNRSGTLRILILLFAGLSASLLSTRLSDDNKQRFLAAIVVMGAVIAVAGFLSQWIIPQGKKLWWIFDAAHGHPVGGFINRNHFAGFLAMLSPIAASLSLHSLKDRKVTASLVWTTCFAFISGAILMSLSRGAWLGYLFANAVTIVLWMKYLPARARLLSAATAIVLFFGVLVSIFSSGALYERVFSFSHITKTSSAKMRTTTWRDAGKIIPDYFVFGTGANGFRMLFPQYRSDASRKEFKHTENEYVQVPVELGSAGVLILLAMIVLYYRAWMPHRKMDNESERLLTLSTAGALVAVGAHSCLDFSLRVPLYFVVMFSIAGLPLKARLDEKRKVLLAPLALSSLLAVFLAATPGLNHFRLDSSDKIEKGDADFLCRSLAAAPTSWQAWYHLGSATLLQGTPEAFDIGEDFISNALFYDPLNYRMWEQLARLRLSLNDIDGALQAYEELVALRDWKKLPEFEKIIEERKGRTE